ncbi:hypothetical protein ACQUJT_09125 [Ralstonia pseudosolanacearum]|uniref:hypothetical protein n=1 Tax=Ralstonia pseudosolanacearum TaxID=1310165 RepID=UPI001E3C4D6B|nr:hypothetical protein [Ralstonia pseudosolanacearum]UWD90710.1 hypothetical protein NY025_24285 [Ralstonia pseudosolanacearum]
MHLLVQRRTVIEEDTVQLSAIRMVALAILLTLTVTTAPGRREEVSARPAMGTFSSATSVVRVLRLDRAETLNEKCPVNKDRSSHTAPGIVVFLASERKKAQGLGASLDGLQRLTAMGLMTKL